MQDAIRVKGARAHNLRNVDVELPRHQLVVLTGVSGSGKSSLAFDTIYAEGQRRYVESLSAYARQFLQLMEKPDVDSIEGLSPAISIEQKTVSKNPRSTVGTVTEIHDYMRLLWARVGVPYSPATGKPIEAQPIEHMVDRVMALPTGRKMYILAPVVRQRKGEFRAEAEHWARAGWERVRVDGEVHRLEAFPTLDRQKKHDIELIIDRLVIQDGLQTRLQEAFEQTLALTEGLAWAEDVETQERLEFSARFSCPDSGFVIPELEPRLFSFNSPIGACPTCDGIGITSAFDPSLFVDPDLPIVKALMPFQTEASTRFRQRLTEMLRASGESEKLWKGLSASWKKKVLYGEGRFPGAIPVLDRRWQEAYMPSHKEDLNRYRADTPCPACQGYRLRPETLCVKIAQCHIGEVSDMGLQEARDWFANVPQTLTPQRQEIARRVLKEIDDRLGFLVDVGLNYLTLSRASGTLSGGEGQRIRLASQVGSGLTGVLYVLDEPSIGLHPRDNGRLLATLKRLRDLGNTVLVVEHDEDTMREADWVLEMGPGAGSLGGQVIAQGRPQDLMQQVGQSLTGEYLSGRRKIEVPQRRRSAKEDQWLTVLGAKGHTLKNLDAAFPLGCFVGVSGVSGSGKSTLVLDTLFHACARQLGGTHRSVAPYRRLEGIDFLDKVIDIDQSPIGRTPRSNPATYTGVFTPIRDWFAGLPEAKARGYGPGRFSFNVKGGRCEACEGDGTVRVEMHFLPDVFVPCDVCKGTRFNRETLEIRYKGASIADVLALTIHEAKELFQAVPRIRNGLDTLERVGLGYVPLGQAATTLSGGEAQRVKLATELARRATGKTLYILDEPTTGLHAEDVRDLLHVLQALVDAGNTVVVIEHNLDMLKSCDWIIDMGPEGGPDGGQIIAQGTPEEIAHSKTYTGVALKEVLSLSQVDVPKPAKTKKRAKA